MSAIPSPPAWWAALVLRRAGVVTRQELERAGLVEHARTCLARGQWSRPLTGLYVTAPPPLTRSQVVWVALLRAGPGAALGGATALVLRGLTGWTPDAVDVCSSRHVRPWDLARFHRLAVVPRVVSAGVPRVPLGLAAVQAASWAHSDEAARTVLRMALQQRVVGPRRVLEQALPGVTRRHVVLAVLDDHASGATTQAEAAFMRAWRRRGLPPLRCQVPFVEDDGRRRFFDITCQPRDMAGLRMVLVLELDGAHHLQPQQRDDDDARSLAATARGFLVVRMTNARVLADPAGAVDQLLAVCRAWGWTG